MATYRGVVRKSDLEGGVWLLHADDGERYQLRGGDDGLRVDGQRVVVEGQVDRGAMGIGMTGPYLAVRSWRAA
ncbi:MAG: hypothetical protein D6689_11840 [Deltaproteobacteria bacterium]|nr:MAG: hypothetical protein D6689_11840 [Deltaproteobacteria bacterium]